ncbi:MAG TPA: hypothetical protein VGL69_02215 [Solirubrobacteraceae bacterium]|jgi:hypothetical protein
MKSLRRRLLLTLYPRSWRRRYGDEFMQYLADLDADRPGGKLGRTFNILVNVIPIQVAHRPATTAAAAFCLSGAIAVTGLYGPGSTTSRDPLVWGWRTVSNPVIIATPHHTYVAPRYSAQEGTGTPAAKIHAVSEHGRSVTIYCRAGTKCRVHSAR